MQLPRAIVPMRVLDVSLHETVAKNVSAAMVYPVLCFIPTRVSLPASMDSIVMTRLRPSKKKLCTQLINSSVQQLYTRVNLCTPCACERAQQQTLVLLASRNRNSTTGVGIIILKGK